MQNFSKLSKILIFVSIVFICAIASYFVFIGQKKATLNSNEKNIIKKDAAEELLDSNAEALKKAENTNDGLVRKIDDTDHILGDINAPVQIIIYDDFDNEFSADYYKTIKQTIEAYGEKIVVAYRHFPMRSHANANVATQASECAGEQGKFWEMVELLFTARSADKLNEDTINSNVVELQLDKAKFDACLTDQKISDKIQASLTQADNINVTGAPTTFINSVPYPGAMPFEDFTDSSGIERRGL